MERQGPAGSLLNLDFGLCQGAWGMSGVALVFEPWDRAKAAQVAARLQEAGLQIENASDVAASLPNGTVSPPAGPTSAVLVLWSATSRLLPVMRRAAADALNRGRLVSAAIDSIKPPKPFSKLPYIDLTAKTGLDGGDTVKALITAVLAVAGPRALASNGSLTPDEAQRWEQLEQTGNSDAFERFSREFPGSQLAAVARERVAQMSAWRGIDFANLEKESGSPRLAFAVVAIIASIIAGAIWFNRDRIFQPSHEIDYPAPSITDPQLPAEPPPIPEPAPAIEAPPVPEPAPSVEVPIDPGLFEPLPPLDPTPAPQAYVPTGRYNVRGTTPTGSTYRGKVDVSTQGGVYFFRWSLTGGEIYYGQGRLEGDTLIIEWGDTTPVVYNVEPGGVLRGAWAGGQATETLTLER